MTHLHLTNNWEGASKLVVDGKAKDSHHGGTAIVELNGTLLVLLLVVEGVPAKIDTEGHVAEVTGEFTGASNVTHDEKLEPADEEDDLEEARAGDGIGAVKGIEAIGDVGELTAG
mmetsp:Transcript_16822/g.33590  ORF Transcript_16822/g.33590 Transcript_16822/m.33590 type:complete len:115 (-) Transcript_16822:87-431(-)